MARSRGGTGYFPGPSDERPLRIIASGTLFRTFTLEVPNHPAPSTVVRAHSVQKTRGGSASTLLSLLAQFPSVESVLVAPLGGDDEGRMVLRELEAEGVNTRYCKVWKGSGVPTAWVLHSAEDTRTVINHNPLPDITHEEFVSLLGPLLAPENYGYNSPSSSPTATLDGNPTHLVLQNPSSPAPFDWIHFEGRSCKTTLSNITGIDGLARERKWRSHCVFSIDVGRRAKQGVEALIPFADILFVNKHYAQATSARYATTPRSFLLSLTSIAPPHALLVYWSLEGGAVLSLPTKEYFQSSSWVEERMTSDNLRDDSDLNALPNEGLDVQSVKSGSDFYYGGGSRTPSSSAFTINRDSNYSESNPETSIPSHSRSGSRNHDPGAPGSHSRYGSDDSQGTEVPEDTDDGVVDEVGAQEAFVAGMIYSLSRKIAPGAPYTPFSGGESSGQSSDSERGRWRLDECLRFATELSGRKARQKNWHGLAAEMRRAGWFDNATRA
ncbi:hypothetical protein C8J56DRAFT_779686 [Mycena floridula]|nr:hypothetical protein C8J56DRAFT_779686 [Mycena floridula]